MSVFSNARNIHYNIISFALILGRSHNIVCVLAMRQFPWSMLVGIHTLICHLFAIHSIVERWCLTSDARSYKSLQCLPLSLKSLPAEEVSSYVVKTCKQLFVEYLRPSTSSQHLARLISEPPWSWILQDQSTWLQEQLTSDFNYVTDSNEDCSQTPSWIAEHQKLDLTSVFIVVLSYYTLRGQLLGSSRWQMKLIDLKLCIHNHGNLCQNELTDQSWWCIPFSFLGNRKEILQECGARNNVECRWFYMDTRYII